LEFQLQLDNNDIVQLLDDIVVGRGRPLTGPQEWALV